jgi:O-antigen/teichoic acid export membrane protein
MIFHNMQPPEWVRLLPKSLRRRLVGRSNLVTIIGNSSWLIGDKLLRLVFGLLVSAWVARYLGPAQFGELAYVLAYIALYQAVATLGLDGIVVRDIALDKSASGAILGTSFSLRLGAGMLCWAGAVGSMALLNGFDDQSVVLTALAGATLVFQAADTVDLWFQSQSQSRRTVLAKLAAFLVSNGIKVVLILTGSPLIAFAAVMALDAIVAGMGLMIAYRRFPGPQRWHNALHTAKHLLREGWPFMLSGISIMIYMRIDQIMIKELLGGYELGVYAAVLPLATVWQFIPMTLMASLAPFVARKKAVSETAYWQALEKIFRVFSLLGWLVFVPTALLASVLVNFLFGDQYQSGSEVLTIYALTNLFINLGVAQNLWLFNEKKAIISLYKTLIGAIACVGLNFILIPILGLNGAAISAVIAMAFASVFSNLLFSRKIFKLQISSFFLIRQKYTS